MPGPSARKRRRSARQLEDLAAAAEPPRPAPVLPPGEAVAMLVRRGFRPSATSADLPFGTEDTEATDALSDRLGHYAFRLFLRGAIQKAGGFAPAGTTRYLKADQAKRFAEELVRLGLARRLPAGRYALLHPARSFGGTLEWYVARELRRRYGMDADGRTRHWERHKAWRRSAWRRPSPSPPARREIRHPHR